MSADLIISGGSVITVDKENRIAEAVAVKGNKIIYVGNQKGVEKFRSTKTKEIDLKGRSLIPGFIESHLHTAVMGLNSLTIDCRPSAVHSIEDIKEAVYDKAKVTPKGEWIRGWGYNDQYLKEKRCPDRWDLDKVAPDNPVMLTRVCSHISSHNSRSIEIAGISNTHEYSDITFTRMNGELSGIMKEEAHMVMCKASVPNEEEIIEGMTAAGNMLIREGITSVHDSGGYGPAQMKAVQRAIEEDRFKIRYYSMIFSFVDNLDFVDSYLKIGIRTGMGSERFKLGPIKLMIDGSSSGPTAATIKPYAIDENNYGILSHSQELVDEYILKAHRGGWQVTSHAVGDKGVTVIVNAIENALRKEPVQDIRHRIEHCAMIDDELLDRIKKLGIVPICNPIFLYEFGDGYITNYGEDMAFKMFTAKSFLDRGIIAAGASDCPITFSDPLMGIHLAVNRKTQGGNVINPDECISQMDALRMFTYNGAYASKEEDIKGSIEEGKLADLVILNGDFIKQSPENIWDMKVDVTIIDGKIEYERGA